MDIQIFVSFVAVAIAGFGLYYDYRFQFLVKSHFAVLLNLIYTSVFRFPYPASSTVSRKFIIHFQTLFLGLRRLLHQLLCLDFSSSTLHDVH